jgi:glycosyltransferase EpsJ
MLTIIIPSFNSENFIQRCLDSIVTQKFSDWHVYIIDGGSHDKTKLICSAFINKAPKKISFISAPQSKQGEARNLGIDLTNTPYLTFIDSDDCYANEEVLNKLMKALDKVNTDFLCSSVRFLDSKSNTIRVIGKFHSKFMYGSEIFIDALLERNIHTIPWNKIYKTSFLKSNNIKFPNVREQEDIYFSRICSYYASCVQFKNLISVNGFIRGDSRSRSMSIKNLTSVNIIFNEINKHICKDKNFKLYLPFLRFSEARSLAYIIIIAASRIDHFKDLLNFHRKITSKNLLNIPFSSKLLFRAKLISIISIYLSKFRFSLYVVRYLKKYFRFGY